MSVRQHILPRKPRNTIQERIDVVKLQGECRIPSIWLSAIPVLHYGHSSVCDIFRKPLILQTFGTRENNRFYKELQLSLEIFFGTVDM